MNIGDVVSFGRFRYQLVLPIATTHLSVVYKAERIDSGQYYVIKVWKQKGQATTQAIQRESQLLASLTSDEANNFVPLHDVGSANGLPAVLYQWYPFNLKIWLETRSVSFDNMMTWLSSIVCALQAIHKRGLHYRDLKPENILIDPATCQVVLADFGSLEEVGSISHSKRCVGSVGWQTPEQQDSATDALIAGSSLTSIETDTFALGLLIFHLVTGRVLDFQAAQQCSTVNDVLSPTITTDEFLSFQQQLDEKTQEFAELGTMDELQSRALLELSEEVPLWLEKALNANPAQRRSLSELEALLLSVKTAFGSVEATQCSGEQNASNVLKANVLFSRRSIVFGVSVLTGFLCVGLLLLYWLQTETAIIPKNQVTPERSDGVLQRIYGDPAQIKTTESSDVAVLPSASVIPSGKALGFIEPELVLISGGNFVLGDEWGIGESDEQHASTMAVKSFYIAKAEVSQKEFKLFVKDTLSVLPDQPMVGDEYPVVNISYTQARDYVVWLSQKSQRNYRLPSELQWEYIAKSAFKGPYAWSEDPLIKANLSGQKLSMVDGVIQYKGIAHLVGNVAEWMSNCAFKSYAKVSSQVFQWTPTVVCHYVVARGSGVTTKRAASYLTNRHVLLNNTNHHAIGLRLAMDFGIGRWQK